MTHGSPHGFLADELAQGHCFYCSIHASIIVMQILLLQQFEVFSYFIVAKTVFQSASVYSFYLSQVIRKIYQCAVTGPVISQCIQQFF